LSLVGRLEDLSPADIVQIVFLSRRSGRLEVHGAAGTFAILFNKGRIAGTISPESPDLRSWLEAKQVCSAEQLGDAARIEAAGVPLGTVLVDFNVVSRAELIGIIEERIADTFNRITALSEGEFNFVLGEGHSSLEVGYELQSLIGDEGYPPQKFLDAGEKLKPLQGLEESFRAGKAFLRGAGKMTPAAEPAPSAPDSEPPPASPPRFDPDSTRPGAPVSRFTVRDDSAISGVSRLTVLVYEPEPVLRVAIKRALAGESFEILQSYAAEECRGEIDRLISEQRFFVSVIDLTGHGPAGAGASLVAHVKRNNPQLPIVAIAEKGTHQSIMQLQPDEVITLPPVAASDRNSGVDAAIRMLATFVAEERDRWHMAVTASGSEQEGSRSFYDQASAQLTSRRFELLELLIMEISDPEDILSLARTLLRAASEYVDRGAIFVLGEDDFLGLAGFGAGGIEEGVNESIKGARIPYTEPSVLRDVVEARQAHRGKLRKTPANVELVQRLGQARPSEVVVLPIAKGSEVVGVLYGDNAGNRSPISETSGLEIFLGQAGRAMQEGLETRAKRARGGAGG